MRITITRRKLGGGNSNKKQGEDANGGPDEQQAKKEDSGPPSLEYEKPEVVVAVVDKEKWDEYTITLDMTAARGQVATGECVVGDKCPGLAITRVLF